jgi:selT/selW/selH-like putative selenoprotein
LREAFGVEAALIAGGGGVFDVRVDDELVYSKHETGEFPDEDGLLAELAARRA